MRYNGSEEDDESQEEIEAFFDEEEDETDHNAQIVEAGILVQEMNHRLLLAAITLCEKSFFWRFRPLKSKLNIVGSAYAHLLELTS